jgi:hypothetical protein
MIRTIRLHRGNGLAFLRRRAGIFAVLLALGAGSFELGAAERRVSGALEMPARIPANYTLVYEQRFNEAAALRDFGFTDPGAWKYAATNNNGALELVRQSKYQPKVRSPVNIALLAEKTFGDFVLEVDLIQTGKEYGHRDMCVFYGVQDPTHFYYTHIATAADDHAHNTFIVTNAPRIKIARETTKGVNWGLGVWHTVRIERTLADGGIKVYFDDMTRPIMTATDKTFGAGYVGFGSFDDTGMVDNIRIWAPSAEARRATFFQQLSN